MFKKIRNYFFLRKLLKEKRALYSIAILDKKYLEKYQGELLTLNEKKIRQQLAIEVKKENPNKELGDTLQTKINDSRSVKLVHQKTLRLLKELPGYISLIEQEIRDLF